MAYDNQNAAFNSTMMKKKSGSRSIFQEWIIGISLFSPTIGIRLSTFFFDKSHRFRVGTYCILCRKNNLTIVQALKKKISFSTQGHRADIGEMIIYRILPNR